MVRLCLLFGYVGWESFEIVGRYFAMQMSRPEVRHVWVEYKRAMIPGQRDIVFNINTISNLTAKLRKATAVADTQPDPQVFGRRYKHTASIAWLPTDGDCINRGGPTAAMLVVNLQEPLFRSASAWSLANWQDGNGVRQPLAQVLDNIKFDPVTDVIVTSDFLRRQRFDTKNATANLERFCLQENAERPVRIVAVLDRLPGTDQFSFDFVIDEENFRDGWIKKPQFGDSNLPDYTIAAIYFDPTTFTTVRDILVNEGIPVRKDAFDALETLLRVSDTAKTMLVVNIRAIGVLAFMSIFLIVDGYIRENERAFFVMRAFGHSYWGLVSLLFLQMTAITVLMSIVATLILYVLDPLLMQPLVLGLGLSSTQLTVSVPKIVSIALLVWAIQLVASIMVSGIWWSKNRFIAERMQAL